MVTLTDEQLEQICDRCHYTYTIDDDEEMHKICGGVPNWKKRRVKTQKSKESAKSSR